MIKLLATAVSDKNILLHGRSKYRNCRSFLHYNAGAVRETFRRKANEEVRLRASFYRQTAEKKGLLTHFLPLLDILEYDGKK